MKLTEILSQVKTKFEITHGRQIVDSLVINDIAIDSRRIKKENSTIFFALNGKEKNGAEFIASAVAKGARVIVSSEVVNFPEVVSIKTEQVFQLLVECLKKFYTPLPTNIYAVTGTNGKTSVAEFIRQIIELVGKKSASIGTLGIICDEGVKSTLTGFELTTPDIISLYKNLHSLKENNINDVAIEVSSIGLEQARIAGLKIDVAGFTNFSQDHLDYHKTMEEYFFCKMLLFEAVMASGCAAVLNADIPEFIKIQRMCQSKKHHVLEYGFKAKDLKLIEVKQQAASQVVIFECNTKKYQIILNITGEFQAMNVLCALGMVMAKHHLSEEKLTELLAKFSQLKAAAGRMQHVVTLPNQAQVFIDFAHSPDALENVLKLARGLVKARLLVLFGCGGDRDNKKRPIMGEIASRLADTVIVTDDNPRSENAKLIRQEILASCDMSRTIEAPGREDAIKKALSMLQPCDILILAGKGHEKYQIIGDKKTEFDEEKIVKNLLK